MDTSVMVGLSLIVIEDMMRRNSTYAQEAIKEWDKYGEGLFAEFVSKYIISKWADMAGRN